MVNVIHHMVFFLDISISDQIHDLPDVMTPTVMELLIFAFTYLYRITPPA